MSKSKAISKKKGFLLMEVLVSVTIIAVGLIYIVRSFSSSTRAIETSVRLLRSAALAEERLWDLEAKGTIEKGRDDGAFKDDEGYTWQYKVERLDDLPINVLKLDIKYRGPREGSGKRGRLSVETYLWNEEES